MRYINSLLLTYLLTGCAGAAQWGSDDSTINLALPIANCGLRLDDEAARVAVGTRYAAGAQFVRPTQLSLRGLIVVIIIINNVYGTVVRPYCQSSPGSFDDCRLGARWPPTIYVLHYV